jgi:lipoyl(octanoyl) transferase
MFPIHIHYLGRAQYNTVLAKQEEIMATLVNKAKLVTQRHFEASKRAVAEGHSEKPEMPIVHDEETPLNILIVEHNPGVFTMGKRDTTHDIRFTENQAQNDEFFSQERQEFIRNLVHLKRGGGLTYHGPGQLTMYPIVHIPSLFKIAPAETKSPKQGALHWYTELLEKTMMKSVTDFGIKHSFAGNTGVWVPNELVGKNNTHSKLENVKIIPPKSRTEAPPNASKIGFIGLDFRQNCSMHGLALNVKMESLKPFEKIVICEMQQAKTTCIEECCSVKIDNVCNEVGKIVSENFLDLLGLKENQKIVYF